MALFSDNEMQEIRATILRNGGHLLITFRNEYGPTRLEKLWRETVERLGSPKRCINWWSSSGNLGLLECELDDGVMVFGQWALSDSTHLIGVFEMSDEDIVDIREGFDAGNVTSSAMRAIRIGETGDRD